MVFSIISIYIFSPLIRSYHVPTVAQNVDLLEFYNFIPTSQSVKKDLSHGRYVWALYMMKNADVYSFAISFRTHRCYSILHTWP